MVIHNISLPPGQFEGDCVEQFFCNRLDPEAHPYFAQIAALQVSAHFYIRRDGTLVQFVDMYARAWHAGVSCFQGRENCNDFSLGVELAGTDDTPYTEAQYQTLARLTRQLMARFAALTRDRIVGHCDIAPGRKTDPGPSFDWALYHGLLQDHA